MIKQSLNHTSLATTANGTPLVAYIASTIRHIRERSPLTRIVVINPSIFSAFFLRRAVTDQLCVKNDDALFNVEFMRIEEVADRLFDALPDQPQKPSMSRLIASELIHNATLQLTTPGPLTEHATNESTLNAIQKTLQELERLDKGSSNALQELSNRTQSRLYPQLEEIQRNYSATAEQYLTRENKAAIVAKIVSQNSDIIASTLASQIIAIRAPMPPDAYTRLWDSMERHSSTTTIRITSGTDQHGNDAHTPTETRFYSTVGAADEPRALIRNIITDAKQGIKFGEIAVLYPTNDYASRIKDALNTAGIKNCGPSTRTLAETPAGKFVSLFLHMVAAEMRRDTFTTWTTSAPVIDPTDGDRVPAVPWEVASRNAKISRFAGDDRWRRSLKRYSRSMRNRARRAEESPDEDYTVDPEAWREMVNATIRLSDFVSKLNDLIQIEHPRSWADWADWLKEIIDNYLAKPRTQDDHAASGLTRVQDDLAQVRDLDKVASTYVDFNRFSRTVQRFLRAILQGDSGWGSTVFVAPLESSIGNSFRSIHILGMAEGGLPRPGRPDPLLSDHLRRILDADGSTLPTTIDHIEFERQTFQLALQSAPLRRLYWNKALLGATNESYPSPWFVDEVVKSNGLTSVPVKDLMDPESDFVESISHLSSLSDSSLNASTEYEFQLKDVALRSSDKTELNQLLTDPTNRALASGKRATASKRTTALGPFDGNIAETRRSAPLNLQISASALQNYAECPYRYFLAAELNVDERIDPEDALTLSALDKGLLVHSILEQFLKEFGPDSTSEGLNQLRQTALEEFDRFQRDDYIGYNAIFDLEKDQILRQLEQWHQTNLDVLSGYEGEMMTEVPFGFEDPLGRMTLEDGFTFQFRGKVDLIALSSARNRALVVDFKTGRSSSYSDIEKDVTASGTKLQLPLYARITNELLENSADVDAAYWFVFQSGSTRLRPKIPVSLEATDERFDEVMSTVVDGIRLGLFPARPGDRDTRGDGPPWKNCKYCAYSDVCSTDRLIAWNRKKSSPALTGYVALAEGESP